MESTKKTEKGGYGLKVYGYAVFNTYTKTISHYEEKMIDAVRTCNKWNKENREF